MNKQQFEDYINHPGQLDSGSLPVLESLVKQFPYCQTAYLLYVKNLYDEKSIHFNQQLKVAAAYASDRKRLKQLILSERVTESKKTETQVPVKPIVTNADIFYPGENISKTERENLSGTALVDEVRRKIKELHETKLISEQVYDINDIIGVGDQKTEVHSVPESDNQILNRQLIEQFIKDKPRFAPSKEGFFDPTEMSKQSMIDDDDFVTETLAEIFLKQGHIDKAIKIYKNLSLKFPEKSSYFAALIKKLGK